MRVIGVDPSLRRTGAVKLDLQKSRNGSQPRVLNVLECAIIESAKGTDVLDVIAEVHEQLLAFQEKDELPVYIEVPVFGKNAGVLIQQGFLIGGVSALLDLDGTRPKLVHPMSVKALLDIPRPPKGGKTDKNDVVRAIRKRVGDPDFLCESNKLDREAICDAIGVALVGVFMEGE